MQGTTLTVIGCGDAFGSGGRLQACFLLDHGDAQVLLDCGATAVAGLRQRGRDPSAVDAIVVTHLHGDHVGGVPFLLADGVYRAARTRPLVVAGPPGIEAHVRAALELFYPGAATHLAERPFLRFEALVPGRETTIGALRVTPIPVVHSRTLTALALRVTADDRVIAYSGDTEWTPSLVEVSRGADVFICECSACDSPVAGHIDYGRLVRERGQLDARRIVLTHLGPEMLARLDEIDMDVAYDGLVITL